MKIFGHPKVNDSVSPIELNEVSIVAEPDVLRSIAVFLNTCADELDSSTGNTWDHEHWKDNNRNGSQGPDIVIVHPRLLRGP